MAGKTSGVRLSSSRSQAYARRLPTWRSRHRHVGGQKTSYPVEMAIELLPAAG